jgi:hypothetical protein
MKMALRTLQTRWSMTFRIIVAVLALVAFAPVAVAEDCVECHKNINPRIVSDWQLSKHGDAGIDCTACHGDQHKSAEDVSKVIFATPETCADCHETQVDQYIAGKHAYAWE